MLLVVARCLLLLVVACCLFNVAVAIYKSVDDFIGVVGVTVELLLKAHQQCSKIMIIGNRNNNKQQPTT